MIGKAIIYAVTHTFDFTGYVRRPLFWTWIAVFTAVSVAISLLEHLGGHEIYTNELQKAMAESAGQPTFAAPTWPGTVFTVLFLVTNLSMIVRRLRDGGYTGSSNYSLSIWFVFVPIIGQIWLIKLLASPSITPSGWTVSVADQQQWQREGYC